MKIVAAVSGGVDSVVMLHQLVQQLNVESSKLKERDSPSTPPRSEVRQSPHLDAMQPARPDDQSGGGNVEKRKQEQDRLKAESSKLQETESPIFHLPSSISQIILAHVDHGWRTDSAADARFVQALADYYQCDCALTRLSLTSQSEAEARAARWKFLREVRDEHQADLIATGHHQDDVLETMLLNLQRGTGRHGLSSLKQTEELVRPLIDWNKSSIYQYAVENRLEWVQDKTNVDERYRRNYVRQNIVSRITVEQRKQLLHIYTSSLEINMQLDALLTKTLSAMVSSDTEPGSIRLRRSDFNRLPFAIQKELSATIINNVTGKPPYDSLQVERTALAIKTARPNSEVELSGTLSSHHSATESKVYARKS